MFNGFRTDRPLGYQQIIGVAASTALTVPIGALAMILTTTTNGIRWRDDGVAPTAAIGYPLATGAELEYTGQLDKFRLIEQAASATVDIAYYGFPL